MKFSKIVKSVKINFLLFLYFQRFPWGNGDQTLFHNPKLNATSQGYEVDE